MNHVIRHPLPFCRVIPTAAHSVPTFVHSLFTGQDHKMPTVLAYWDIRGLAEPIRLLLHYVGEEFEDKHFSTGPAPDFNKECWTGVKHSLGLDFPNLPYYIDGDIKLTQSNAILRHLARKYNLYGSTPQEQAAADLLAEQAMDFRNGLVGVCYNPKANELLGGYLKGLKAHLDAFTRFLGDKKFFIGNSVTFVDFVMYELLDQHKFLFKDSLQGYDKLNAFLDRFENLPKIKEYMTSPKYTKLPCNNKMAVFK